MERSIRYKRYSVDEKRQFIAEASSVGNTMSLVSRKYGIAPSCLYEWRRQMEEGALVGLKTGEAVVPLSDYKALKAQLNKLERMLGRKTIEVEILKEAVELGREKKLISRAPLHGVEGFR
jgi:transposase